MAGPVTIDWGDGSPKQDGPEKGEVSHTYGTDAAGEQKITVCAKDDPTKCTTTTFTPGEDGQPAEDLKVTAAEDTADTSRMTVKATIDNTGQGPVKVDFGDGSTPVDGPETGDVARKYERAGKFTITVTDADDTQRKGTAAVTVPFGPVTNPKAEAVADEADTTGRTVKLTWSGFPQGTVTVNWGDDSPEETGKPAPDGELTHKYADTVTGEQTITVTSEGDTEVKAEATFTPAGSGGQEPAKPFARVEPAEDEPLRALLSWGSFPPGKVVLDWGDGGEKEQADADQDGNGDAGHTYGEDLAGKEQTITVTAADDETKKATATFTPEKGGGQEPGAVVLTVVEDKADTTNRRSVIATVDNAGKPATIDFGEGEAVDNPGDGTTETKHAYTKDGTYTVTAVDEDDEARKDTQQVTVPFTDGGEEPAKPTAKATADTADKAGRTALLTYDGFPQGKVSVDWGDGSEAEQADGRPKGQASHSYAAGVSGEQTITVTSVEDEKAKATAVFTPKEPEGGDTPPAGGEDDKPPADGAEQPPADDDADGGEKPAPTTARAARRRYR